MIRNAVLHINNEQPMRADLLDLPGAGDVGLRCTNLRTMNGQRPVSVDDSGSLFFFPYLHIRFVEIPPGSLAGTDVALPVTARALDSGPPAEAEPELDLEIDEDFLRRIREV
ncbi:MAG: hypothetical protein H0U58_01150 [Chloroflexi bacterium]|nr:hypothetical protein [Chloroflexota bacterium]